MTRSRSRYPLLTFLLLSIAACAGDDDPEPVRTPTEDEPAPYGATGVENIRVTPGEIEIPGLPAGWEGARFAVLSDLQLGLWEGNEEVARAAVERALAQEPDAVLLLGDYIAEGEDFAALERVLAPLRGTPTFAVLGNEDMREEPEGPDSTAIRTVQALERIGIRVLQNERAPFVRGGDTAYIAGVEPYVARRPDWRRAEIYNAIPGGPETPLVLSHMPAAAANIPIDRYPAILAGSTFCGRNVEVPGTPRLTWVNTEVFPGTPEPATTRINRVRGSTLFITCGVGYSFVPVRFGAPPEVALVTLRRPGGPDLLAADSARARTAEIDSLIEVYQGADTTRRE